MVIEAIAVHPTDAERALDVGAWVLFELNRTLGREDFTVPALRARLAFAVRQARVPVIPEDEDGDDAA